VAATTGSYNAGRAEPSTLEIYYADNWSAIGHWQLARIPAGAQITTVKVKWELFSALPSQNYRGLELVLFNQAKKVKLQKNSSGNYVVTNKFSGQPLTNNWRLKYKVDYLQPEGNYLGLIPKLIINYRISR